MTVDALVVQQLGAQSLEIIRLQVRLAETLAKLAAVESKLVSLKNGTNDA